jgi:hypothetical protein
MILYLSHTRTIYARDPWFRHLKYKVSIVDNGPSSGDV